MPLPLSVTEDDLVDLKRRLRDTRWAAPWPSTSWETGTDRNELRRLVTYWSEEFDWNTQRRRMAALPRHTADIGAAAVTYLRFDAERLGDLPIVLTNGWPSSVLELVEVAQRLATPSAFGGDPNHAVTVIVPALPGLPSRSTVTLG